MKTPKTNNDEVEQLKAQLESAQETTKRALETLEFTRKTRQEAIDVARRKTQIVDFFAKNLIQERNETLARLQRLDARITALGYASVIT